MNTAVTLNHTRRQWVDLGILEDACITRPETCGAAGAAVAFWIRIDLITYDVAPGIMSSYKNGPFSGMTIRLYTDGMRFVSVNHAEHGLLKLVRINFDKYLNMNIYNINVNLVISFQVYPLPT